MLRSKKSLFVYVIIGVFIMISVTAQNAFADMADDNLAFSKVTSPPVGKTAGESRRTGMDPVDDRVELREYLFTDTGEMLPYAVFISSKVKKDEKAPLVLALHGFSGNHGTFMRRQCVDEAEKNGYIMIGAMGYSPTGPFGMQMRMPGPPKIDAEAPGAPNGSTSSAKPKPKSFMYMGGDIGGKKEKDPAKVTEFSEKDTMNVLNIALKEFNIDKDRIYLMGHSMGGGGALHIAEKYSDIWAAVAGVAPATFGFDWSADMKLKNLPLLIIVGEDDTLVKGAEQVADQLKSLDFKVEYKSMPGLDHGEIIGGSMPDVFDFFNRHIKAK
ncbi:MAG: prolyl oligopeptidase family serine peptidase [Deltaproteobacteria bacterium]|nr:prolyl oligopeptidase family serine peptidase [Deltaproteobacteria bacterium]